MIPAIILVPLFNFFLVNYFGDKCNKKYREYGQKYIAHLKDHEILDFETLYAKL